MSELLTALAIGLASGVAPGPMLILVVSTSLQHGLAAGVRVALAPLLSDLPIVAVVFSLFSWVQAHTRWIGMLAIAGSIYLAWFGWRELRGRPHGLNDWEIKPMSMKQAATINFLNPHPWMFWIGVGGPVVFSNSGQGLQGGSVFVAGFYFALIGAKICVAWFISQSRDGLSPAAYRIILKCAAAVLLLFAATLFWEGTQLIAVK